MINHIGKPSLRGLTLHLAGTNSDIFFYLLITLQRYNSHVYRLHAQEVVKISMQLTDLCHGLHFYADILFQLAGTDVTREYEGHVVGINQFQESRALHVGTWRLLELISRKIYLCKNKLLDLFLVVHLSLKTLK